MVDEDAVVGPVVGPILDHITSSEGAVPRGLGYDVAVNDLTFRLLVTDDTPYERATAQFRKDQLDDSPNPGDQSLTGWWTRGQFSFHRGSGVKYYDVNEEVLLNRYESAIGLDPFTPGEVTCYPAWTTGTTTTLSSIANVAAVDATTIAVHAGGSVYHGNTGGALTQYVPDIGSAVSMCVGGGSIFVALSDNTIDRLDAGVPTTLYTHSTTIEDIFFAKDRLLILDTAGKWHAVAPRPSGALPIALAAGDEVFTSNAGKWCVSDSPGPILLGNRNRVFAVTQTSTGDIPTMSGPVQVVDLPTDEVVVQLAAYLGFVVILTDKGVRIGVLSDSGQVSYGPLLIEWTSAPTDTTIGRQGSRVAVAGGGRLYEIDLAQQIGQGLEFGWTELPNPLLGAETNYGLTTFKGGMVAWDDDSLLIQSDSLSAGTLTTGFHRFGTMEPKDFREVTVRLGGGGGTVRVSKVDAEGTAVSLYTFDVSVQNTATLNLAVPGAEMLALKFELTPSVLDPEVGPILLGYQIRAMPQPRRQRLIRLPLDITDQGRRGTARAVGRKGAAWDSLQRLEDLESSGVVVTFRDFRTGEVAQCYVESIEFRGTTPPSAQSGGYGGVCNLTLRRLIA